MSATHTFYAASIPRYLRAPRLSHLPLDAVIGSKMIENKTGPNQYFDVVMLPPVAFNRMRHYLAGGHTAAMDYSRGGGLAMTVYQLQDVRRIDVPLHINDPKTYAVTEVIRLYELDVRRTVYRGAPSVVSSLRQRLRPSLRVEPTRTLAESGVPVITLENQPPGFRLSPLAAALQGLRSLDPARRRDRLVFNQPPVQPRLRQSSRPSQLQA